MTHSPPPKRDAHRRSPTVPRPVLLTLPAERSATTAPTWATPALSFSGKPRVGKCHKTPLVPSWPHFIPAPNTTPPIAHSLCLETVTRHGQDWKEGMSHPRIHAFSGERRRRGASVGLRAREMEQMNKDAKIQGPSRALDHRRASCSACRHLEQNNVWRHGSTRHLS